MELKESSLMVAEPQAASFEPAEQPGVIPTPTRVVIREIIETLLLTLLIFWVVNAITGRFRIEGHSMLPTLHEGEYVLINKLAYYLEDPQRGDIIVLQFPQDRTRDFIKRIIGLPGDQIEIGDRQVKVNGQALTEPYIADEPDYAGTWTVPAGQYFVLGDNRNNSSDSHSWQFLPFSDIVGKAWLIYWPPGDAKPVPHYSHLIGQG